MKSRRGTITLISSDINMSKSPAEKRPKVYAHGAGRDWRIVTTKDLPVMYTVKEVVDIEALDAYVLCMGSKPLKQSDPHG